MRVRYRPHELPFLPSAFAVFGEHGHEQLASDQILSSRSDGLEDRTLGICSRGRSQKETRRFRGSEVLRLQGHDDVTRLAQRHFDAVDGRGRSEKRGIFELPNPLVREIPPNRFSIADASRLDVGRYQSPRRSESKFVAGPHGRATCSGDGKHGARNRAAHGQGTSICDLDRWVTWSGMARRRTADAIATWP